MRELEQWFLRITQYSDQLLDDMKELEDGWPERVLSMQRNWIGKSRGARVRFNVAQIDDLTIEVFTTRIDTIYGATALVLSAGHPAALRLVDGVRGPSRHGSADQSDAAEEHARRGCRHGREGRILHRAIRRESVFGRELAYLDREFRSRGVWNRRANGSSSPR